VVRSPEQRLPDYAHGDAKAKAGILLRLFGADAGLYDIRSRLTRFPYCTAGEVVGRRLA